MAWAVADRGVADVAGGAPGTADFGGGPGAPLPDAPPGPDTPVKICSRGHVNPPGAWLCMDPGCGEDISSGDIVPFGARAAAGGASAGTGIPEPAGPGGSPGGGERRQAGDGTGPGAAPVQAEDVPPIFYREEEQLIFVLDGTASFAVRDGDGVGRLAKGAVLLERWPTVSRRHLKVAFREGKWYVTSLSDNGTYVNGAYLEKGSAAEVGPGDEVKLSTRVALGVAP
ncbi:MAG: FHA domain-containing protein [Deltaproteobacteria bacterium]|nr:FHA domain-containing protein [Deltaproteobacteria bacterium]